MRACKIFSVFLLVAFFACVSKLQARRAKTLAFLADPSCLSSMLVEEIEKTLAEHLKVKRIKVLQKDKANADITVHYFIVERKNLDGVTVQLDGRAFEKSSGKLVAEGTAVSDPHQADDEGKISAARQASRDLALAISEALEKNLFTMVSFNSLQAITKQ